MKRILRIYQGIGESRFGLIEKGRLVELHIERESDGTRPRADEVWTGRVKRVAPDLGGAFIDLGEGEPGFLRFTTSPGAPRLAEGQLLDVVVRREAEPGKGPILLYKNRHSRDSVGRLTEVDTLTRLRNRYADLDERQGAVPSLLDTVEAELAIPGGGTICIEPTRALVAVDVDKGSQPSTVRVALAAVPLIAEQLRLRGLGGLVCIDFPNLRQPKQRQQLERAVADAFQADPENPKIAPLSRFGVIEMTRTRSRRSLDDLLRTTPEETAAIAALDRLLAEGKAHAGAQLTLTVPEAVLAFMEGWGVAWRERAAERLGARFVVQAGDRTDVEADR